MKRRTELVGCDHYILSSTKQGMTIFGRDQIELWAKQVAKGKITEEEFGGDGERVGVNDGYEISRTDFCIVKVVSTKQKGDLHIQTALNNI